MELEKPHKDSVSGVEFIYRDLMNVIIRNRNVRAGLETMTTEVKVDSGVTGRDIQGLLQMVFGVERLEYGHG